MIYRKLGKTGLKVSVLSIGGSSFKPRNNSDTDLINANKIFSFYVKNGIFILKKIETRLQGCMI